MMSSARATPPAALLVLLLAGCDGLLRPSVPDVSGVWTYSAQNFGECSISNLTLTLAQEGTSFSGTYADGVLVCDQIPYAIQPGRVEQGVLEGSTIRFEFGAGTVRNEGRLEGGSMSGEVEFDLDGGEEPRTGRGSWHAQR